MNLELARRLRSKAGNLACRSPVYNWSLGGSLPEKSDVKLSDPWPGDAERGRSLCGGIFDMGSERLEMHGDIWSPYGASSAWYEYLHGFEWLRDLRSLGGDIGRSRARELLASWIKSHAYWDETCWRPDILGGRISMWLALYDFFGASADDGLQKLFMDSLVRQARHLSRSISGVPSGAGVFKACKGLVFAGAFFSGCEPWIETALERLDREVERQILADGGHISRSPDQLLKVLQVLLDIRCALSAARYPLPENIQHAIDRICPALRFFRYADKHMAVFNGANEGDKALMDAALVQANARGRPLKGLPQTGYERVTLGRSLLLVDCAAPPEWPFDDRAHAAPLSFEFCHGRERIFVNCGTHDAGREWGDILRGTAAHNSVCLNFRNADDVRPDGHMSRKIRKVTAERQDSDDATLLDMSHDGYVAVNGITHRRRLYLSDNGNDLRGEERLTCSTGISRPVDVCARFHLHPKVQVSLVQDNREALLLLPSGAGWRFSHSAGDLAVEESVYLGEGGGPRKTRQIVIYGTMESDLAQIKWRLCRERK